MAPSRAQADAVREGVASASTCNSTISASLKQLLQDVATDTTEPTPKTATSTRTTKVAASKAARTRPKTTTTKTATTSRATKSTTTLESDTSLPPKEKAVLATQVINTTLKALGDAIKNADSAPPAPVQDAEDSAPTTSRKTLRRSISMPMAPLQPRALNKVSTSPMTDEKATTASSAKVPSGVLALVECAHVAFACLRTLQLAGAVALPELQLESGLSSFVNKLIGLSLYEHAFKEIRVLKRRLETLATPNDEPNSKARPASTGATTTTAAKVFSELIDFPSVGTTGPLLNLMISTQLQALRIVHGMSKSSHLAVLVPGLRCTNPSSPLQLVLSAVKNGTTDRAKGAKQLETVSQTILSLTCSLSTKDDPIALEPKLNSSPESCLEAQAIALVIKLYGWHVSKCNGDVDKEVYLPLSKCIQAFARRAQGEQGPVYQQMKSAYSQVSDKAESMSLQPSTSSKAPTSIIFQIFGPAAQEAGYLKEAVAWTTKVKNRIDTTTDTPARRCAVASQLLALLLKTGTQPEESLLGEVLEGLQGPLSGSTVELDDLLTSVCALRKAAISTLLGSQKKPIGSSLQSQLRELIYQLPRFSLRWLGKPPTTPGSTKELLRFEQRRQLLKKYVNLIIDSALMLLKGQLDKDTLGWNDMDPILQDVLSLLEHFNDSFRANIKTNPSNSYHVKVSHFYYQQHLSLRKSADKTAETASLRALRRSVDSVKSTSQPERSRAQLLVKWERFAELCRLSGRKDEAVNTIRAIRDHLVMEEVVQQLKVALSTQPVATAWRLSPETEALSRSVCNLVKIDKEPTDWTWLLEGGAKFVALEHDLYYVYAEGSRHCTVEDFTPVVTTLLGLYPYPEYPIRRFRTLLRAAMRSLGSEGSGAHWHEEINTITSSLTSTNLGEDSGLERFVPHLQNIARCLQALDEGDLDTPFVREALGSWGSTLSKCTTAEQLSDRVDDIEQFLTILQTLSDFAKVRGLQLLSADALELATRVSQLNSDTSSDNHLIHSSTLILQQLQLGRSTRAGLIIAQNEETIAQLDLASDASASFHLAAAEYNLALGNHDKAEVHILAAQNNATGLSKNVAKKLSGPERRLLTARASSVASLLALERGESQQALDFAKAAVQSVFHDWARFESQQSTTDEQSADVSQHDATDVDSSMDQSASTITKTHTGPSGPRFWKTACALFDYTSRLSWLYAHFGLYQETLYYAGQAQKIASTTQSEVYTMQSTAWLSFVHLNAGDITKAVELAGSLLPTMNTVEPTYQNVQALCQLSRVYQEADSPIAGDVIGKAETMIKMLAQTDGLVSPQPEDALEEKMAKMSIAESASSRASSRTSSRQAKAARATTAKHTRTKSAPVKTTVSRAKARAQTPVPVAMQDTLLRQLQAAVYHQRSLISIKHKEWSDAVGTLEKALPLSTLSMDISEVRYMQAVSLVGQSLEKMGHDSVFSVLQESTLSFPATAGSGKDRLAVDRASLARSPISRLAAGDMQSFQDGLRQAQEHLLEAHSIAVRNGNGSLVHRVSVLLQSVFVLLSITVSQKAGRAGHPSHATCSVEMARNLIWRRERKAVMQGSSASEWPVLSASSEDYRRSSLGPASDMAIFQRDYVDIIPESWNVVSLSLGAGQHELCITKLQAGHSPFAIRLPLERAGSRDIDAVVFDFPQGRAELLDIIKEINQSCHDARDMSQKGAKSEWWAEREALDERMKDLLDNVEQTWLGGFKGIFAPGQRRSDLLARFQASFMDILSKHLPSRRTVRGKKPKTASGSKVTLDPRIYELFVSLGDATIPDADLDEPLNDLLYFVVDILQFNGERNAYDEIDFDAMVVDTFDAIHSYQTEIKSNTDGQENAAHTILIVDKSLHIFPWESLPCMEGAAVSRMPSLASLRRLILDHEILQRGQQPTQHGDDEMDTDNTSDNISLQGHTISLKSGSYILNPGADLQNTQSAFGKPLASLPPTWTAIEGRVPTETEFEKSLTSTDLLLYFGHGSGAQYIRGRTVRRMDKCRAVALLMGCSSASLADVGEFECHGPVWNYMLAGSPAVSGTLWDVTDRDIDRFAGKMFENWGLLPLGTFDGKEKEDSGNAKTSGRGRGRKGKGKATKRDKGSEGGGGEVEGKRADKSLIEAVVMARDACRFRYLTAAAVVVYGIPVYIGQ